jgi:hypothetical protein
MYIHTSRGSLLSDIFYSGFDNINDVYKDADADDYYKTTTIIDGHTKNSNSNSNNNNINNTHSNTNNNTNNNTTFMTKITQQLTTSSHLHHHHFHHHQYHLGLLYHIISYPIQYYTIQYDTIEGFFLSLLFCLLIATFNNQGVSFAWSILLLTRLFVTFTLAISTETLIIDYLFLETQLAVKSIGRVLTLMTVQAKGWPMRIVFWALWNFILIIGDAKWKRHWL